MLRSTLGDQDTLQWFNGLFRKLLIADVSSQLPGTPTQSSLSIDAAECRQLLGAASALALRDDETAKSIAYEVVSRLLELFPENRVLSSTVDVILSRLGNFPGRKLLRQRYQSSGSASPPPVRLGIESLVREVENSVPGPDGQPFPLTDFQFNLFRDLNQFPSVSVSAPTSAGKSFVMGLDLIRRMKVTDPASIVYVVPTRALIRQVSGDIRRFLRMSGMADIPVRSVPFPVPADKAPKGVIFVLTQERLMSLLHAREGTPWITTLIVDEAQSIRDDARGVILQSAIEATLIRFPNAEVHFASPLSSNPESLLQLIGRESTGKSAVETISPVSQNLILVSEVYRKPNQASFLLQTLDEDIDLGVRKLGFEFRGSVYTQRASFAKAITQADESTILYANDPSDTEELAKALVAGLQPPSSLDPEIAELIDYVKTEIHQDYPLIDTLPHGVAYHYGYMPAIVRSRVEDLFKDQKLKFVCCTSTLLQGVNLPARHIVIENPKRGRSGAMARRDFVNLAGRAGRLLREFHGNVWCLRATKWDEQCYKGDQLQEITSAVDDAMQDGGTIIQKTLKNELGDREIDYGEAALGKMFCDYAKKDLKLSDSTWKTPENATAIAETDRLLSELKISLPDEILDANRAVRPDRLQALYDRMKGEPEIETLVPLRPGVAGSNDRMGAIIQIVQATLGGVDNNSYLFYKWLAMQWIYNTPLNVILQRRLVFLRSQGNKDSVSLIIRELLKTLEHAIRFRLVKYYRAYCDILALVLREAGLDAQADAIEPFHVYLECGASDRVALNLISIGLSRSTALSLRKSIQFSEEATPEECLAILAASNLEATGIPRLCVREVQSLLGHI